MDMGSGILMSVIKWCGYELSVWKWVCLKKCGCWWLLGV